ncbi:hypothetical protein ACWDRB_62770 [Nonomuraea sp. NPDC003707]
MEPTGEEPGAQQARAARERIADVVRRMGGGLLNPARSVFTGHTGMVDEVAFAPGGRLLAWPGATAPSGCGTSPPGGSSAAR